MRIPKMTHAAQKQVLEENISYLRQLMSDDRRILDRKIKMMKDEFELSSQSRRNQIAVLLEKLSCLTASTEESR